jgi:hypothetical protein
MRWDDAHRVGVAREYRAFFAPRLPAKSRKDFCDVLAQSWYKAARAARCLVELHRKPQHPHEPAPWMIKVRHHPLHQSLRVGEHTVYALFWPARHSCRV